MYRKRLTAASLCLLFAFVTGPTCEGQDAKLENARAEKPAKLRQRMLGVWVLAGKPGAEIEPQPGARMRFFGLGHWVITEHNPDDGKVIFHHGGTYTLDGDRYTEKITFANESTEEMIGSEFKFTITVKDGKYIQIGDGNPFSEVWLRPKKTIERGTTKR